MPQSLDRRKLLVLGGAAAIGAVAWPALAGTASAESAQPTRPAYPGLPRVIDVDGALNTRDVGGYRTSVGRTVRFGRAYRTGSLTDVTGKGLEQLAALNLRIVVDYRYADEIAYYGPYRIPAGVKLIHLPVGAAPTPAEQLRKVGSTLVPAAAPPTGPDPASIATYRSYTSNPASRKQFARSLQLLATASDLPLMYGDTAGGGRAGWTTALLLTALGVPQDAVYYDYLYSNTLLGGTYVFREYLDAAFDQAVKMYGTLSNFYAEGLGVTPAVQLALTTNFLSSCGPIGPEAALACPL